MDIVRWLSLVLFGFFWIGLIVVYELSLFDKELTSLLAKYARYESDQSGPTMPTVVLLAQGQGRKQMSRDSRGQANAREWDMASNFWMDVNDEQNQQVIGDSRPLPHKQPMSRFEKFSKIRYSSQKMQLNTLGRLGHLLTRHSLQEIHRQKRRLEVLKANYTGSEWKETIRALDRLERSVFEELARKSLVEPEVRDMVLSADELLAELTGKEPAMHKQLTKMFYSTKRMRVAALLKVLRQQKQSKQQKQSMGPVLPGRYHMSKQASKQLREEIEPVFDEMEKLAKQENIQYDFVSKDGALKIKYLKRKQESQKQSQSKEKMAWLKNKFLAAAQSQRQRSEEEHEALSQADMASERGKQVKAVKPEVQEEELEEDANSNYAYDLKIDVKDGKIEAVPANGPVDPEVLHARMVEQRKREMQAKRKAHAEDKARRVESMEQGAGEKARKAGKAGRAGFRTAKIGKDLMKDYDYEYSY